MEKIMILLCLCLCVLTGCGVHADDILQNSVSEERVVTEDSVAIESDSSGLDIESQDSDENRTDSAENEDAGAGVGNETDVATVYVYVCGAVNSPGVYELPEDSRLYQAVELAGGLSGDADEKSVNLAEKVTDGQMIRIPTVEESASGQTGTGTASVTLPTSGDNRVNINTASAEELTDLNGIGETKAEAIIAYREAHGGFQSADEIMQVDGIGEGTYQKIQDDICVE